jgi:hypothetical protein
MAMAMTMVRLMAMAMAMRKSGELKQELNRMGMRNTEETKNSEAVGMAMNPTPGSGRSVNLREKPKAFLSLINADGWRRWWERKMHEKQKRSPLEEEEI